MLQMRPNDFAPALLNRFMDFPGIGSTEPADKDEKHARPRELSGGPNDNLMRAAAAIGAALLDPVSRPIETDLGNGSGFADDLRFGPRNLDDATFFSATFNQGYEFSFEFEQTDDGYSLSIDFESYSSYDATGFAMGSAGFGAFAASTSTQTSFSLDLEFSRSTDGGYEQSLSVEMEMIEETSLFAAYSGIAGRGPNSPSAGFLSETTVRSEASVALELLLDTDEDGSQSSEVFFTAERLDEYYRAIGIK